MRAWGNRQQEEEVNTKEKTNLLFSSGVEQ